MHLQQTKRKSRASGGPQYYFHDLSEPVKLYLRNKGAVKVALVTPYGATKSKYFAVSSDKKLDNNLKPILGKVGHDRIQQGHARMSIGESIRHWYNLPAGDFERIDLDIEIIDNSFYITPMICKFACSSRKIEISRIERPLTFTKDYVSPLWIKQLEFSDKNCPGILKWSTEEICRIVKDHRPKTKLAHIQETDILRASGPLKHLGVQLGGYVGKGYDCNTIFSFLDYPNYDVPVEIKKESNGFKYQQQKYGKDELSRAVLLCAIHNLKNIPRNIDVIELDAICKFI